MSRCRQLYSNGNVDVIGTSHANEISRLAMEHPEQKPSIIFGIPNRNERLLLRGVVDFFSFVRLAKNRQDFILVIYFTFPLVLNLVSILNPV